MAKIIPNYPPEEISLPSERKVAVELVSQLPADVVVFHSYPWLRPERNDYTGKSPLAQGEADFVILHPNYGFLVLEVKGGIVHYDSANRRWNRINGTHQMKDPFDQARGNEHSIVAEIDRRAKQALLPGVRGHAVVFPDCNWSGTAAPGADPTIILDASHLSSLASKIESIFRHYDRRSNPRRLTPEELNILLFGLTSTFKLTPVRWRQIEEQERQILRFTEEQAKILEFIEDRPQAIINGVAGSGKTQLAVAKARRFAAEGKKVLLLCFNAMLAEAFKDQLQDEPTVTALNYHKLVRDWCVKAKVKFPASPETGFWGEPAALLLENAIDILGSKESFDAVVVDEGQDFHEKWWDSVQLINKQLTDGPLYIFTDPNQRLYHNHATVLPYLGQPFSLVVNCRNTRNISTWSGSKIGKEIQVRDGTPHGEVLKITRQPTEAEQRACIVELLKQWTHPDSGLNYNQIAVLGAYKPENGSLKGLDKLGKIPIAQDYAAWRSGKGVFVGTVHSFKGLEADAVILYDIPNLAANSDGSVFTASHLYVAATRAKHLLAVIER